MSPSSSSIPTSGIVLKVQQGTVRGSGSLCRTCRNSMVMRGTNNQESVTCGGQSYPVQIYFEVAECNRYFCRDQPTLYEMEEIAWRLITKQAGRQIGFVSAADFRKMAEVHKDQGI